MSPQQLANLIDSYAPALILFARQWCSAPEDVVQDAFLKLVTQRSSPEDPLAWLYRVVRNGAMDAAKTTRRRQQRELASARPERWFIEPEIDGLDAQAAIEALKELALEQREVIVAHLWGGLTFEQIGALCNCSASSAFRRYTAGIAALRARLGNECTNPVK
jgi:RNA polymerase sigma-70 factor (ECF subfamily)